MSSVSAKAVSAPSLLLVLAAAFAGAAHECERECVIGDTRTCHYEFSLQEYHTMSRACFNCPENLEDCSRQECISADGVPRPVITINRQLPGPSIQVCEGDRLVVDLYNLLLSDTETIHWHGMHMRNQQYYDGVPFLTQCPVIRGKFRYDFKASTPGTLFWHSHAGLHRASGVLGSLVVRQAEDPHRGLYDTDLPEHVIMLSDWSHTSVATQFTGRHHSQGDDYARTILVNGKGRNSAAKLEGAEAAQVPLEVIKVTPGLRHRLRFVGGTGLNCPVVVSVDGHQLAVIATDGEPIVPFITDSFVIYSGERFDVVLEANQATDNYWFRFNGLIDCSKMECVQGAVLRYEGAPDQEPLGSLTYDPSYPGVVVNPLNTAGDALEEVTMVELDALMPSMLQQAVDKQFYLGFDFKRVNNTLLYNPELYPYNAVSEEWQVNTPQINGISFLSPPSPPLSQPHDPQPTLCYYGQDPICEGDFCRCTYVLEVALGETVEFVLVDEGNIGDENHPFHMHGYHFHVVAMGRLGHNTSLAEVAALDAAGGITRKLEDAVLKDTVTIPDGGYTIIRFTADNPGWWLMHCHLVFHSEMDMVAALHVGGLDDVPPVPENFPTCGSFMPAL